MTTQRAAIRGFSRLVFDPRLLDGARDPALTLLERGRQLARFRSRLDEALAGAPLELAAEAAAIRASAQAHQRVLTEDLLPALARHRIRLLRPEELDEADHAALADRFRRHVLPVLTPVAVDAAHPFPRLANGGLAVVVEVAPLARGRLRAPPVVVIPVPAAARRFHRVVTRWAERAYVLVEDLVRARVDDLLPGPPVSSAAIRVVRAGATARVHHEAALGEGARALLVRALGVGERDLVATEGFAALADPAALFAEVVLPSLRDPFVRRPAPYGGGAQWTSPSSSAPRSRTAASAAIEAPTTHPSGFGSGAGPGSSSSG